MKASLETIPSLADRSFYVADQVLSRFDCPFHYHPEFELTFIASSTGQRYVGDHIGRFAHGDLVLMGPYLPHSYINDVRFAGNARSIVVQFLPACFGSGFFDLGELKGVRQLLDRSRVGLVFRGRARDEAAAAMEQFTAAKNLDRVILLLKILGVLAGSRAYRRLASPGYSPSLAMYQGERIKRVCELIARRFRTNVTQSEAACLAGMSGPSFSRFFRRATNRTFRDFLNQVRIGHACHLLLESDLTVTEICFDAGFSNLSNFNRQFLRRQKTTPRNYRHRAAEQLSRIPPADHWPR